MKKVKDMIRELELFPQDAECYAYAGENMGLVIRKGNEEIGYIPCREIYGKGTKRYDIFKVEGDSGKLRDKTTGGN